MAEEKGCELYTDGTLREGGDHEGICFGGVSTSRNWRVRKAERVLLQAPRELQANVFRDYSHAALSRP